MSEDRISAWETRMKKLKEKAEDAEKLEADALRIAYLKRTGRKEMKP